MKNYLLLQSSLSNVGIKTCDEQIEILLEKFGIDYLMNQQISLLSGGEKQRIALLAIFLQKVDLLLLNEPTGSLDFENSQRIWNLLKSLWQKNITIIAVSHDEAIKPLADSVHQLDYGILK